MSKKPPFTPSTIDALRSGTIRDARTAGLFIEGMPSGKRIFRYQRRISGTTRMHKATLGTFPAYTVAEAQEWAQAINRTVERGIDPNEKAKADAQSRVTVAAAWAIYIAEVRLGMHKAKQCKLKERTILDKGRMFTLDIDPAFGTRQLATITSKELWDLVNARGVEAPVRANRLAAELKVFFKFCCSEQGASIGLAADPSSKLSGKRFEETERTRALSTTEMTLLLRALATEKRKVQRAVLLLMMSGCRLMEVIESKKTEMIDGVWIINGSRIKNGQTHVLPLGPWGRSLFTVNTEWMFTSDKKSVGAQSCGWTKIFKRLETKMVELNGAPIEHFTPHDLRRTFSTEAQKRGVAFAVKEALLNHKKKKLGKSYDQYDYFPEKRAALADWEGVLIEMAKGAGVAEELGVPE